MQSLAAGIVGIFFLWAMWTTAHMGYSRSLAENGSETRQLSLADRAVKLSPSDPETHYHRAALLWAADDKTGAIREAEHAVALRPRDYFLWFRLGFYRYFAEDMAGALGPFREAARLAPYYAQPHFFIGNILLLQGQREEAFAELRRAAASDPEFFPDIITLAGKTFGDDTKSIELAIQPQARDARLALAQYFVQHGKTDEALKLFRAAGPSEQEQRGFLTELLRAKRFPEAFEVWSSSRKQSEAGIGRLNDGGFEGQISLNHPGFGWQQAQDLQGMQISLDTTAPRAGTQSVLLVFEGQAKPGTTLLKQLVRVEPNTRYGVRFAARATDIVTGGLPFIAILDANDQKTLAEKDLLVQSSLGGDWQNHMIDFATAGTTSAIIISLQRRNCRTLPCPIFGRLWLDNFSMNRMD